MQKLKINEDFMALIPHLTAEEFSALELSVKNEGCRDPLVIMEDGIIIDGHHRYKICVANNIEFNTITKKDIVSEADAKLWMIKNQIGKRNLSVIQRAELAIHLESIEKIRAKERQGARTDLIESNFLPDLVGSSKQGHALEQAAKSVGLGYETVRKTKKIFEQAPVEVIEKVKQGDISIDRAYINLQKAERLANNIIAEWPKDKYRIIYADPPWQYGDERSGGSYGGAVDHYPTMSMQELYDLPVHSIVEEDAVLFIWATAPLLEESLNLVKSWGFKYKTQFVWDKVKHNMGHYNSVRHELLLIATKGKCTPDNVQLFDSVQTIERTEKHSEKPEEFRSIIETLYTYGNKIELFARKKIDGWEVFGNEL